MNRRLIIVAAVVLAVLLGGFAMFRYMFAEAEPAYSTYTPPPKSAAMTDEQRVFQLQNDLGNAAAEMAQLQTMAKKLQFGKMKAMGRHLQQRADELQPQLADIQDPQAKKLLKQGIEGLRTVGQGSEELDPDKSMKGVNEVLTSFDKLNQYNAQ